MKKHIRILSFILMLTLLFIPFLNIYNKSLNIGNINIGINNNDNLNLFYSYEGFFNNVNNSISPVLILISRIFIIISMILVISYGVLLFIDFETTKINLKLISSLIFILLLFSLIMLLIVGLQNYYFLDNKVNLYFSVGFYLLCIPFAGSIVGMVSSNNKNNE